ncbi:N-alpha-acetyltransferase, non-catalitic subunit [Sporothrix eucalyptigena]
MSDGEARDALRLPRDEPVPTQGIKDLSLAPDQDQEPPIPPPPPPSSESRIISDGIMLMDITSRFTRAASTLEPGELVKDGYFTLFESVGALEIMDPKMDSGCVSAEELDQQITRSLLPAEVVGIIDQLLCLEEEDASTNTYHLSLLNEVSRDEIRQVLQEAREAIVDTTHGWADNVCLALEARLDFRETFLTAMELAELRIQPDSLKVPWTQMATAIKNIQSSHDLGIAVPAAFNTKMQGLLASTMPPRPIVQPSFEEAIQNWSRLCVDGAEAVDILRYQDPQSLLNFVLTFQAKKPQPLAYIRTLVQSFIFAENIMLGEHSIREIMDDDLAIVVLPANMLLDPLNDEVEAVHDPRFALAKQMEEFRIRCFPAYLEIFRTLCQNRSRSRRMMCHILQEWEQVQIDVEEIDNLVQSALDEIPGNSLLSGNSPADNPLPLSSWAFLYKIRLMEWVVQLGFELEIYQADELAGMYWYLSYLSKRRVTHCERIRTFTLRSLGEMRQRTGGRALPGDQEAVMMKSLSFLQTMLLDASVTWELSDALSCLYAALQRTGLLKVPVRPYSTDELRYELRMKPFASIGLPALPPFETFKKEADQANTNVTVILEYAEKALGAAKKGCEMLTRFTEEEAFSANHYEQWLARTKGMLKSAIFAGLAVATVKKEVLRVEKDGGTVGGSGDRGSNGATELKLTAEVPKPDKSYHEWWIVPKVAPAK